MKDEYVYEVLGFDEKEWEQFFAKSLFEFAEIITSERHTEAAKKLIEWLNEGDGVAKATIISMLFEALTAVAMASLDPAAAKFTIIVGQYLNDIGMNLRRGKK